MARYRRVAPKPIVVVPTPPPAPAVDLGSLKKDELVGLATAAGVDASGTKAEIQARLEGGR